MSRLAMDSNNHGVQAIYCGTSQILAVTTTAGVSTSFSTATKFVELYATQDMWISIGSAPTAASGATNSKFLPAGFIVVYGCDANDSVSAIRVSSSGSLYITEAKK